MHIYVDFDNCLNCWYMFDLADLWIHNEGWTRRENDPAKRFELMQQCLGLQLEGYRSETEIPEEMLNQLPLFIDMVLIENIVDEFECCEREGEEIDYEDIENAPVPERAPAFILSCITVFFPLEFLRSMEYNKRQLVLANCFGHAWVVLADAEQLEEILFFNPPVSKC